MSNYTAAERRAKMLDRVRKLLNMARDGNSECEQEIAMRRANHLMVEFGIAEAECDMAAIDAGEIILGESKVGPDGKTPTEGRVYRSWPQFAGVLCIGVAKFTETIVIRKTGEHGQVIVFRGEKEDVLLAKWLFGVLIVSIQTAQKRSGWTQRGEASTFRNAAASILQRRLKDLAAERHKMYEAAQAQSGSRALVVVNRKRDMIAERFGMQKTKSTQRKTLSSGAEDAGKSAGYKITIPAGRPLENATPRGYLN